VEPEPKHVAETTPTVQNLMFNMDIFLKNGTNKKQFILLIYITLEDIQDHRAKKLRPPSFFVENVVFV
jgi:hypothetical protein